MPDKIKIPHFFARVCMLLAGLFCIALGVAFSTKSGLGVSPSSSLPYLLSTMLPLSMGTFTTLINIVFVFVQIALLRSRYKPVQLLQLAVVFVFGFFTDFTIALAKPLRADSYPLQLALCVLSCAIMGFGLFLEVKAGLLTMASEGAISAIAQVFGLDFGRVKISTDCGFVVLSSVLSLVVYHRLLGIREGTVIAAVLVGLFVQLYNKKLRFVEPLLGQKPEAPPSQKPAVPLVITIERELGSGGHELGERLASELGLAFYDYALISSAAEATGLTAEAVERSEERITNSLLFNLYQSSYAASSKVSRQDAIFAAQSDVIRKYAQAGGCVIVGRLGSYVLRGRPNCLHLFVSAEESFRAERLKTRYGLTLEQALQRLRKEDARRRNYCQHFTGEPWGLARHYALTLDTGAYGIDGAVRLALEAAASYNGTAKQA